MDEITKGYEKFIEKKQVILNGTEVFANHNFSLLLKPRQG